MRACVPPPSPCWNVFLRSTIGLDDIFVTPCAPGSVRRLFEGEFVIPALQNAFRLQVADSAEWHGGWCEIA